MIQDDHWFPIGRLVVIEEAFGRSVTEYMMDGVSAKSELQADEFMSLFCRIIDWETFPDFIHL